MLLLQNHVGLFSFALFLPLHPLSLSLSSSSVYNIYATNGVGMQLIIIIMALLVASLFAEMCKSFLYLTIAKKNSC